MMSVDARYKKGTYRSVRGVKTKGKVAMILFSPFLLTYDIIIRKYFPHVCNNSVLYYTVLDNLCLNWERYK